MPCPKLYKDTHTINYMANIGNEAERLRRIQVLTDLLIKLKKEHKEIDAEGMILETMRVQGVTRRTAQEYLKMAFSNLDAAKPLV